MATFLYRLGRLAFRRRRLVVMLWIAVLAVVGIGSASVSGTLSDQFTIPGTQSQKALDLLDREFPQAAASGATARVVFAAPDGQQLTSGAHRTEVESLIADLNKAPQVANVSDPYANRLISRDGTITYAQVTYRVAQADVTTKARDALHAVAAEGKESAKAAELIGIAVAAVALVITFGSLLAAGLPLLTALLGVVIAILSITIATAIWDMSSSASTLALMLGLAVAIDYALFIVSRYRGEIRAGHEPEDAGGRALGTAGSAVVFAGLTVVIALAGLSVVGIRLLSDLGLAAAFAVVVAMVVALTLLPAVLGFAGTRIMNGNLRTKRMRALERGEGEPMGVRWVRLVIRRPWRALLASVALLGVLSVPAFAMQLGMPDDSTAPPGSTQRIAYDTLSKGFGPGYNGPLTVVVDARHSKDPKAAAEETVAALDELPDVASVSPAVFNTSGDVALIRAVPKSSPNSQNTVDLVGEIRGTTAPAVLKATDAEVVITGTTALNIDFSDKLGDALVPYLLVVVGLAVILLLLVFRSVLVPVKATLGFLLSVTATLGVLVAVFQRGWLKDVFGVDTTGPIVSVMPIFMIGVVFGLAMDYQVFLVTRMREEYVHGAEPTEAVIAGFRHGARVVTAAAIIMISVFAGFLLADAALIKSIGLGLASAVLFDAFVVRMTIAPAVMALLGRRAWALPRRLDRILPDVDVEGEKLRHVLDGPTATTQPGGDAEPAGAQDKALAPARRGQD
ncbi:MMPL family transporter [Streptomyces caniscabiei]|uniref:MMPL family transporter n=1 Tax=Streptomyces caniscabiei TaxID=2746961 RepID=UPI0029B598D9|nr:MMPL family transporter [Streptomyces caniscabiei]MDX3726059.1 MMPL family transporter [Streptomyces caniscabiei]